MLLSVPSVVTGRQCSSRGVQSGWVGSKHGLGGEVDMFGDQLMSKCRVVMKPMKILRYTIDSYCDDFKVVHGRPGHWSSMV